MQSFFWGIFILLYLFFLYPLKEKRRISGKLQFETRAVVVHGLFYGTNFSACTEIRTAEFFYVGIEHDLIGTGVCSEEIIFAINLCEVKNYIKLILITFSFVGEN